MVINIRSALDECSDHIADIRRRNETLIDYYIYPQPVPTVIAGYDGPLTTLQSRVKSIKKLNFSQLEQLIDDPDCVAADHLKAIVTDLLNAIVGFKALFEAHYDPHISHHGHYASTYSALEALHFRLQELIRIRHANPQRARAEQLLVLTSTPHHFCRAGVELLNNTDRGLIAAVADRHLLPANYAVLTAQGGAFLWWVCPVATCSFRLRFHVLGSHASSIHNNAEVRAHPAIPLEYRSAFLIKSHLHTTTTNSSSDGSGSTGAMKYGCLFCFAEGKPLHAFGSAFATGRELALHVAGLHTGSKLPAAMVLEKVKVAVGGRCPVGLRRWDVNLLAA